MRGEPVSAPGEHVYGDECGRARIARHARKDGGPRRRRKYLIVVGLAGDGAEPGTARARGGVAVALRQREIRDAGAAIEREDFDARGFNAETKHHAPATRVFARFVASSLATSATAPARASEKPACSQGGQLDPQAYRRAGGSTTCMRAV